MSARTRSLEKSIYIDAPPDVVFRFFCDPGKMVRWCGEEAELQPEPGGLFRIRFEGGVVSEGRYVVVDPPRRVVFTVGMTGTAVPVGGSRVEVDLSPEGEGTRVRLRHEGFDPSQPVSEGWDHHLGRLRRAARGDILGPDRFVAEEGHPQPEAGRPPEAERSERAPSNPPPGYPRISPYLDYEDTGAMLEWLSRAFGLVERHAIRQPDGSVSHAEMALEDGVVMMGTPGGGYRNPRHLGQSTQSLYVYVDDLDAHCERARAAGAEIIEEPADQAYGDRRYGARDPEGHRWYFASRLPGGGHG